MKTYTCVLYNNDWIIDIHTRFLDTCESIVYYCSEVRDIQGELRITCSTRHGQHAPIDPNGFNPCIICITLAAVYLSTSVCHCRFVSIAVHYTFSHYVWPTTENLYIVHIRINGRHCDGRLTVTGIPVRFHQFMTGHRCCRTLPCQHQLLHKRVSSCK